MIFLCVMIVIILTAIIDIGYHVIFDASTIILILLKIIELFMSRTLSTNLLICIIGSSLILVLINKVTFFLINKKMFSDGDIGWIVALTSWHGIECLDRLLGFSALLMILYKLIRNDSSSLPIPMAPFLGLTFFYLFYS